MESGKQKLDITKGYKTKRADTLISPVALIVTSDFKREIPIAKDCSIQDCSLIFNNTNETVYNKGVFNYEIIEVKGNILKIKCGKNTVVYYKDETMAIKFKEWIELKNRVHLYY